MEKENKGEEQGQQPLFTCEDVRRLTMVEAAQEDSAAPLDHKAIEMREAPAEPIETTH